MEEVELAMSEVRVIARSVARGGKENQLRELLRGMLAPTRAESGCKLYELYESGSEGRFYFYEIWESQAALDQHAASPHFRHLEQTVGELVREPFEVNVLDEHPDQSGGNVMLKDSDAEFHFEEGMRDEEHDERYER